VDNVLAMILCDPKCTVTELGIVASSLSSCELANTLSALQIAVAPPGTALERLHIADLNDRSQCQTLAQSLPNIQQLKELCLELGDRTEHMQQELLHGFECNSSLVSVDVTFHHHHHHYDPCHARKEERDKAKLQYYCQRNKNVLIRQVRQTYCCVLDSLSYVNYSNNKSRVSKKTINQSNGS
jgi:hypothetical protein